MKLLLAQPALPRFQWELEVLLANIRQFTEMEVILLFVADDFTVPIPFRGRAGCSVFVYDNPKEEYIPAVRPYLLWQYLKEDSAREQETYFYIDSDVIFRDWPDMQKISPSVNSVIGSDCDHYLGYNYVAKCQQGAEIALKMAEICGITVEQMRGARGIGAHLILTKPTAAFWERSYSDSRRIHTYLKGVDSNIQKWTAEMWAQFLGWIREGKTLMIDSELDFCLPTDPIERFDEVKILHNAGVTVERSYELFFKGQYLNKSPFGRDLSFVRKDKASYRYVEAIDKVLV